MAPLSACSRRLKVRPRPRLRSRYNTHPSINPPYLFNQSLSQPIIQPLHSISTDQTTQSIKRLTKENHRRKDLRRIPGEPDRRRDGGRIARLCDAAREDQEDGQEGQQWRDGRPDHVCIRPRIKRLYGDVCRIITGKEKRERQRHTEGKVLHCTAR